MDTKTSILATKEDLARTDSKIETSKAEMMKWMFAFWICQMATIFGLILLFIKK